MITQLEGNLIEKTPSYAVVDCNGIGFMINISLYTYSQLPEVGEKCKLFSHLQIKEDANTLYGFSSKYERDVFRLLISVSGIGASSARMMLSASNPGELANNIALGNVAMIQSLKGIGPKTAQRLVVELKDKIQKLASELPNAAVLDNKPAEEALSALMQLGFSKPVAFKAIRSALKSNDKEVTVEEIIRLALKML